MVAWAFAHSPTRALVIFEFRNRRQVKTLKRFQPVKTVVLERRVPWLSAGLVRVWAEL